MSGGTLVTYDPNPALAWLYARFFAHVEVDETWADSVRRADAQGTVVYVLRNLSFVDFLALDHLTKRLGLPQVKFANDLGLWVLEPMGRGWLSALQRRSPGDDVTRLRRAVDEGASAALFLKRPPSLLEAPPTLLAQGAPAPTSSRSPSRGRSEGDELLRALVRAQHESKTPILLVPQVFVWSKRPDDVEQGVVDALFGPREWPGKLRTVAQFLGNYRHVTLRAGEPVRLDEFVKAERGQPDDALVRRLTYLLLRRLERERRAVVGPAKKPGDRLREQVLRSPKLQKTIADLAGGDAERRVLTTRAGAMLGELESALDPASLAVMDRAFDQTVARMYSAVEVDDAGIEALREKAKDGTLVFLPSHKSHLDYIVLTRVLLHARLPAPLIAAGDNLSFFPLGPVLRRGGAFFIRRSFRGDRLYGAVVDAYVRRLLKDGWPLEFFLEGGRSRTGKLLSPKLGLLSMVVDAALATQGRAVWFCPVSIGYERLVEEAAHVRENSGGEKAKEDVKGLFDAAATVTGRYGRLNVQFGEPVTLEQVLEDMGEPASAPRSGPPSPRAGARGLSPARRRALVQRLAHRVMHEIARVTSVTPSALVAAALLTLGRRGASHDEVFAHAERTAAMLERAGARFAPSLVARTSPVRLREGAIREACELFARAGHVTIRRSEDGSSRPRAGGLGAALRLFRSPEARARDRAARAKVGPGALYVVPDDARLPLDLSKGALVHFFVARAMIATSLLSSADAGEPALAEAELRDRVQRLSRLFKYEFSFRADQTFDQNFDETLAAMLADGELARRPAPEGGGLLAPAAAVEGRARLVFYARLVRTYVEGYRLAARALTLLVKGPMAPKELGKRALALGDTLFVQGEIEWRESLSRPVVENGFAALIDLGYLGRDGDKLALPESYADAATAETVESMVRGYLVRSADWR